jgi:hypothetical protein
MLPVAADEIVSDSEDDDASRYQWESQYHEAVSLACLDVYFLDFLCRNFWISQMLITSEEALGFVLILLVVSSATLTCNTYGTLRFDRMGKWVTDAATNALLCDSAPLVSVR